MKIAAPSIEKWEAVDPYSFKHKEYIDDFFDNLESKRGIIRYSRVFLDIIQLLKDRKNARELSGPCDFAKRDIIYNNLIIQVPESSRSLLMDRKRFHLLIIMCHYLNQEYFDKDAYDQLGPFYKIKPKLSGDSKDEIKSK
jgi:hypothetical protein